MFNAELQRIWNCAYYSRVLLGSIFPLSPSSVFGDVSDDGWFWLNTGGYRKRRLLRSILPSMPPEDLQAKIVGSAGDNALREGFAGYRLFKSLYEKHAGSIADCDAILDFGCGWGRILRFFLRDLDPKSLWGTDCRQDLIETCKRTNKWCHFCLNDPAPPTLFSDNVVDLVYCYSVFSHLAEEIHLLWLQEFRRILRRGGLLIVTTWHREFLEWCAALRADRNLECEPNWRKQLVYAFRETEKSLADYDAGQFCFNAYDRHSDAWAWLNGKALYGEASIPRAYVLNVWTEYFDCLEFTDDRSLCPQNVIVMRKR